MSFEILTLLLCYSQLIIFEDSYNSSVPKIEAWHDTHKPLASKCAFSLCQWNYELHGKFPNFFCGILLGTFEIVKNTFLETQEFFFYFKRYVDVNMDTSKRSLNSHDIALSCIVLWDCIWKTSLSDCNCTRTQNHLVCKRTLSHLESSCSHLNFIFRTCFEQWVPWH